MKAIFINVRLKEVSTIYIEDHLPYFYKLLECELVQAVPSLLNHVMWIDEESLLHKEHLPGAFMFQNSVYGGHGLITGINFDGDNVDCTLDVFQIRGLVKFIPIEWLPEPGFYVQSF